MKEQEPIQTTQGEIELTSKANSSNLERGDIFMPEGAEGPKPEQIETQKPKLRPEDTVGILARGAAKTIIEKGLSFPPELEGASVEVKNAYEAEMAARAAGKQTTITKEGPQSVTVTEKPVRKPRAPRKIKEAEKPPAPPSSASPEPEENKPDNKQKKEINPEEIVDGLKREFESRKSQFPPDEIGQMDEEVKDAISAGFSKEIAEFQILDAHTRMRGRERAADSEGYHLPDSLEDLATLIMNSESVEWKTGGRKELIRDGKVVKEHFLAWIRKRAVEIDRFNPTSTINVFSDINVKFGYSQISLLEMVLTGSYFLKKVEQPDGTIIRTKDKDYEKLKNEIINFSFLYNNDKNKSVTYKSRMGVEDELPKTMIELYYADPNFREAYLEQQFTQASTNKDKIKNSAGEDYEGNEIEKIMEGNNDLGEGLRRAYLTYFHMADYEMLKKMAEANGGSLLLSKKYWKFNDDNEIVMTEAKPGEEKKPVMIESEVMEGVEFDEEGKVLEYLYEYKKDALGEYELDGKGNKIIERDRTGKPIYKKDAKGGLIKNKKNIKKFIHFINLFNDSSKDTRIVNEVRARIRQDLMLNLGLDFEEAELAERWAYNKALPTGVGGRTDDGASAFDSSARGQQLLSYRLKTYEEKRKGQIGNPYDIEIVKRTGLTPMEEIVDVNGRTVIEAIQGGQGSEYSPLNPFRKKNIDGSENKDYKKMMFGQDEGQRWSTMSFANGEAVRHLIMEGKGFDIDQFTSQDKHGRVIIDQEKADEFLERVQKTMRYKWSTWRGTDYSKTVRVMDWQLTYDNNEDGSAKIDRNGNHAHYYEPVWRDMPILSAYFGAEVVGLIKNDIKRVKERTGKTDDDLRGKGKDKRAENVWKMGGIGGDEKIDVSQVQDSDIRDFLWKQVEKGFIAKTLEAHRNPHSELPRFSYAVVERFYEFFKQKRIWDDEDIKEVRKLSLTTQPDLLVEEAPADILFGFLGGMFKEMIKLTPSLPK